MNYEMTIFATHKPLQRRLILSSTFCFFGLIIILAEKTPSKTSAGGRKKVFRNSKFNTKTKIYSFCY